MARLLQKRRRRVSDNMNKQINFHALKSFVLAIVFLTAFSNVFGASSAADKMARSLVINNLSARLKTDLAQTDVLVKLANVEQRELSKGAIEIKGDAFCVLNTTKNQLPIRFEAKINVASKSVSSIKYDFVNDREIAASADYAPTMTEEILSKELMKKISRDYKTDNIVIALDGVENERNSVGEKQFSGVGEVRIGDFVWNKIKFSVVLDENGRAKKIAYDVDKK